MWVNKLLYSCDKILLGGEKGRNYWYTARTNLKKEKAYYVKLVSCTATPHRKHSCIAPFKLRSIKWNLIYNGQKANRSLPRNNESEKRIYGVQGYQEPLECDKEGSCHYGGGKGVKGGSTQSNAHQIDTLTMRNLPKTEEELSSQTEGLRQVCHHFRQLICLSHGTLFMKWCSPASRAGG